jgi:acetolactate synthase I/II/III large subunit
MKLFEVAGNVIVEEGITRYFGLMGDGNMSLITYLSGQLGIPFVSSRHEAGAIGMADGYARASGNVAVCTVTQGPGLTNTMTALVTARKARSPMVLFAGDVAKVQAGWPQDTDQDAFFRAVGIPVVHLTDPRTVLADVRDAFRLAREDSTPVAVDCPIDSQQEEWNPWDADLDQPAEQRSAARAAEADISRAAELLSQARRPLIIAGRGALRAGGAAELVALGERVGALLATTLAAKGLFEGQPFDLGIVGSLGTNLGVALAGRADVVLAVGASLNDFTTLKGTLFSDQAKIIRCDLRDDASPNRWHEDLLLTGDAKAVSEQLLEAIPASTAREGFRTAEVTQSLRELDITTEFVDKSERNKMDPRTLMVLLDGLLPRDRQVVTDVGHFFGFPATYLRLGGGGRYLAAVEFGAVGSGLGVAIGAALARPELTTVLFLGDGGLLMSLSDLNTVARTGANLVIVVVDDAAYGSELQMLRNWKLPEDAAVLDNPDIAAVAGALGLRTFSVRSAADLQALEGKVSASDGPLLLDCHVTQNVIAGWLEGAFIH